MRAWRMACSKTCTGIVPMTFALAASGASLVLATSVARADQFHYNNVLVGTRSVGMGGAFGAVADDASGVYYNPAGLAFALSNDIQGSANAFYSKKTIYEKTIGDSAFVEESSGSLSPFFGGLQKLDKYVEGLVFAFGVYYVDGDLKDQDTLIQNTPYSGATIERYHRTSNARASTYYAGAALGYRPTSNLAVGFGLNYLNADELVQEFQGVKTSVTAENGNVTYQHNSINVREHLTVYGMQPVLGVQMALPANFALGLTVKKGILASEKLEVTSETQTTTFTTAGATDTDGVKIDGTSYKATYTEVNAEPMGDWPVETRLGLAWFATPTLLWAFDVTHNGEVDAPKLKAFGDKSRYSRGAVLNYHTGIEWYASPSMPLRLGVFTNNDARPEVKEKTYTGSATSPCGDADYAKDYCGQPDHIDYMGESLFIAWVQPNSQISAGVVLQQGSGKAQKTGDHKVQDVKASSTSFAFSATHNL